MTEPVPFKAPRRRQIPGEPSSQPSSNGNGHHAAAKQPILLTTPLSARPGAPVALAEGQAALDALQAYLPPEWAAAAFPTAMWSEIDWSCLTGRRPIIVPENSAYGADRASKLEEYLRHVGINASVLALPEGIPEGWKIDDGMPEGQSLFFERPRIDTPASLGEMFSAIELGQVQFPALSWVIEGWLPVGLAVLVGPPKVGKSWIAMDFATEISEGRPVFGKIPTQQCHVLYLALEDPPRRLKERMEKMLAGKPHSQRLTFATNWPKLDAGGLEKLADYLDNVPETKLVIVDIWARVRGEPKGNKSVYNLDYDDVAALHKMANQRGVALLLIHHTRKQDATDIFDSISGSQGIAGAADSIMVLKRPRGEPTGQFAITGRDIAQDGLFAVRFDPESCKWTLLGEAKAVKKENDQQRVYETLFASDMPMRVQDIADESEIALNTVRSALQRLKKRNAVHMTEHGVWGIAGKDYKSGKNRAD